MKKILYFAFLLLPALNPYKVAAQLSVTQGAAMNMTPLQLVQSQLVGQGVTVSNATFNGSSATISSNQIGYFTASGFAAHELQMNAGTLLTSGCAINAIGPNINCDMTCDFGGLGDPDLTAMAKVATHDKCVLEFDFVPQADTLKFRYIFGSDEFFFWCNAFNDAFGFFLSGPGITGPYSNNSVNIALMPGTSNAVTIDNICADSTVSWCNTPVDCHPDPNNHNPVPSYGNCANPRGHGDWLEYNGFTYVLTAWYVVVPCSTYHIKLAVADALDWAWDSGVFLEKNSFTSTSIEVTNTYTIPSLGQGAVEGCSDATVSFVLANPASQPYTVNYTVGGTAIMGTDYLPIPDSLIIPQNQDSTALVIHAIMDGIPEGTETVILNINTPSCNGPGSLMDTIRIFDNSPMSVSLGNDTLLCLGNSITLHADPTGGQSNYQYLWSTGSTIQSITITPPTGVHNYSVTVTDGCNAPAIDTIMVSVYQPPIVTNNPTLFTSCSGATISIHLTSNVPGSVFSWKASCNSSAVSGYADGSGDSISQTLINTGVTHDTVIYRVHAANIGCVGPVVTLKVIVIPSPTVYFQPDGQIFCSGHTTNISLLSNDPSATFSWTFTPGSPNVTGASNGTGIAIVQLLFNTGYNIDSVVYHVTPSDNGCIGTVKDVTVNLKPLPIVSLIHCTDSKTTSNSKPFKLKGGIPLGGTYSGPGVNSGTGILSPSIAGIGVKTLHYSYTNFYGCSSSATETITVASPPGFFCGNLFTDIRDNKQYPTVQFGTQCWFAVNLNYGTNILASVMQTDNCQPEKYCYQDISANCTLDGGLYQWDEVMQYSDVPGIQGFCPPAWHVPTETDWNVLFSLFYNNGYAGSPLKFTGYSGFNALLAGTRFENSNWYFSTFATLFWSSVIAGSEKAWAHGMNTFNPSVSFYPSLRSNAFSVRCIKD